MTDNPLSKAPDGCTILRPYQSRAVEAVKEAFRSARSVCLVAPTGGGKTLLGLEVVARTLARNPAMQALWVCHRIELVEQARERAVLFGIPPTRFRADTVQGFVARGEVPEAGLLVLDECFATGTPVLMADFSWRPIEKIVVGDAVASWSEETGCVVAAPTTATFSKTAQSTVRVEMSNGATVETTPDHPWLLADGSWCSAVDLPTGASLQQDRHRRHPNQGGGRSGRGVALRTESSSTRREKGRAAHLDGTDGSSLPKRLRVVAVRYGTENRPVFDLEVAGTHTYVVAGAVVHNCHRYSAGAPEFHAFAEKYRTGWRLGLTATPQRADGTPLGDVFGAMVVAATHSELLASGHLVRCRTIRPDGPIAGLAQDPATAVAEHAADRRAFVFARDVAAAEALVHAIEATGSTAAVVTGETPAAERARRIESFRLGLVRHLVNIFVFTEGIDIPAADCCVLARPVGSAGAYLQMVGRVLRPSPGKADALLLDLPGASWTWGLPGEDVEYSLAGDGIVTRGERDAEEAKKAERLASIRVFNRALAECYEGARTPDAAKDAEWLRLRGVAIHKDIGLVWAAEKYQSLFKATPSELLRLTEGERRWEYLRLLEWARSKGVKDGAAAFRFKQAFGEWPRWEWKARRA